MKEEFRNGAARLQDLATELGTTLGLHTFPAVMKEALRMAGLPVGPCRKPVGRMPAAARQKLAAVLEKLRAAGYLAGAAERVTA